MATQNVVQEIGDGLDTIFGVILEGARAFDAMKGDDTPVTSSPPLASNPTVQSGPSPELPQETEPGDAGMPGWIGVVVIGLLAVLILRR
jgi:hypothetical protein